MRLDKALPFRLFLDTHTKPEMDGVVGFGGTGTYAIPVIPLNPQSTSISGGPGIGFGAGMGAIGTYAWFQKAYGFDEAPSHVPLGLRR